MGAADNEDRRPLPLIIKILAQPPLSLIDTVRQHFITAVQTPAKCYPQRYPGGLK